MKAKIVGAVLLLVLAGCASTPVYVSPVAVEKYTTLPEFQQDLTKAKVKKRGRIDFCDMTTGRGKILVPLMNGNYDVTETRGCGFIL